MNDPRAPSPAAAAALALLRARDADDPAGALERAGPEALTLLCDVALDAHELSADGRARRRAAALLLASDAPQAREAHALLLADRDEGVVLRAVRAVPRRGRADLAPRLARMLASPATSALVVAEALHALAALGDAGGDALRRYAAGKDAAPHRAHPIVADALARLGVARRDAG